MGTDAKAVAPEPVKNPGEGSQNNLRPRGLLLSLCFGLVAGFYLAANFAPRRIVIPSENRPVPNEIPLPSDAAEIQSCSDHRGQLFVKPADIPTGPIYMVKDGRVIGLEFMLEKEHLVNGESFKFLSGLGLHVNHVNIGIVSQGHAGYTVPHYHVDLYSVGRSVEEAIKCPSSPPVNEATGSGEMGPMKMVTP